MNVGPTEVLLFTLGIPVPLALMLIARKARMMGAIWAALAIGALSLLAGFGPAITNFILVAIVTMVAWSVVRVVRGQRRNTLAPPSSRASRRHLFLVLGACAVVVSLLALWASREWMAPGQTAPTAPALGATDSDLCAWLMKTQVLRGKRISKLSAFTQWYSKYGADNASAPDLAARNELATILKEYQPYQQQFIDEWTRLGPHPMGQKFWEKELESNQRRVAAMADIVSAADAGDADRFARGWAGVAEAAKIGRAGEAAMVEIWSKCTPQ